MGHETAQVSTKNCLSLQNRASTSKAFAGNHPRQFLYCTQSQYLVGECYLAPTKTMPGSCYHSLTWFKIKTCVLIFNHKIGDSLSYLLSAALASLFKSPWRVIMYKWLRAWCISKGEAALHEEVNREFKKVQIYQ